MAVSKREVVAYAELLQLIARMVLAAVAALQDDDPVDFDAVKIALSPEDALQRLQRERAGQNK